MNALAKKLLIKSNTTWLFYNAPEGYINLLDPLPDNVKVAFEPAGEADGVHVFIKSMADLVDGIKAIKAVAKADTVIWLSYPKKSSGVKTDLNLDMMNNWPEVTEAGLETVSLVAIDSTWSALRIKPIGERKASGLGNAEVKQSDHSAYIDVDKKTVTVPPDVQQALEAEPAALATYNKLAYSHRKEYVLWILTAKQQKTRDDRMVKMVDMLLNGKKNPADK
ncbi:YdeI family protein [Mucilaginibacter sp. AW1-3]